MGRCCAWLEVYTVYGENLTDRARQDRGGAEGTEGAEGKST